MSDEQNRSTVTNPVLREALARVERNRRCAFPYWANWGNWVNWYNWVNWNNWANWLNWINGY